MSVKPRQPKPATSHTDSLLKEGSTAEITQQANANLADSLLFPCPEDGCTKSYMTYGRLEQHLMYGKHQFRWAESVSLIDRAKVSYAESNRTDSDDEAEEFARHQAAVHSDVMEVLRQEITHPLLFSGKNLCLMTESEIESLKITQMRSIVSHFSIKVKARKKNVYSVAIIEFLKRCSCKQ